MTSGTLDNNAICCGHVVPAAYFALCFGLLISAIAHRGVLNEYYHFCQTAFVIFGRPPPPSYNLKRQQMYHNIIFMYSRCLQTRT